jgi:restriction system protein
MIDWNSMVFGAVKGMLVSVPTFWPWWLGCGMLFALKSLFRALEARRLGRSGIQDLDVMDGRTFEKYLEVLFGKLGYRVECTRYVGDYGADLVVWQGGVKTVIQAKRHKKPVGVKAIQEAVAAKGYYGCSEAMVVTNSTYTAPAVQLAQANRVILWDRERLIQALLSVAPVEQPQTDAAPVPAPAAEPLPQSVSEPPVSRNPAPAQAAEPAISTGAAATACATCAKLVSEKVRDYCVAHAGRFGGEVYCYEHQRGARCEAAAGTPR